MKKLIMNNNVIIDFLKPNFSINFGEKNAKAPIQITGTEVNKLNLKLESPKTS